MLLSRARTGRRLKNLLLPSPVQGKHPATGFNTLPCTEVIDSDEDIWGLWELNLTAPDTQSVRRYQVIVVWRIDGRAQYLIDMGPKDIYPVDQISIPGMWIISVAKARDVADEIRYKNLQQEMSIEPEDLYNGYFDEMDIQRLQMKRISQFGKHHMVQRSL